MVIEGEVLNDFPRFIAILVAEFAAGGAVNLVFKMKEDMIIENLDLKPTIDAMMRDFLDTMRVVFAATVGWTPFVDAALLLVVGEIGPYLDGAARCRACRHGRFAAMPDVSALCLTVFSNLMYPLWAMKTLLHFWLMDSRG
ncbi:hypothetical protein Tco_0228694 [Tanacetum coccineum]